MRVLSIAGGLWLLALSLFASDAGVGVIGFFLFVYGGFALAVWWLVRRIRFAMALRRDSDAPKPPRRQWFIIPVCLFAGIAMNFVEGPRNPLFLARFRLSEPALAREAQRLLRAPGLAFDARRVGLFRVQRTEVVNGQVRFVTVTCGMIDSCGFVYSPVTEPKRWQEDSFAPIRNRWWHLYERF